MKAPGQLRRQRIKGLLERLQANADRMDFMLTPRVEVKEFVPVEHLDAGLMVLRHDERYTLLPNGQILVEVIP